MKKAMKKIAIPLLSVAMLLGSMSVPAFAEARVSSDLCPSCMSGAIEERMTREYEHDESFPCSHGYKAGIDVYAVYKVKEIRKCNNCSHDESMTYEDHVFKACYGYGGKG